MTVFWLALAMLIGGLVVCFLSPSAKYPLAVKLFFWLGLIVACIGGLLLLTPILIWIGTQLRAAIGSP